MKVNKKQLSKIIKEEIGKALGENEGEELKNVLNEAEYSWAGLVKRHVEHIQSMPEPSKSGAIMSFEDMAAGDQEFAHYHPEVPLEELRFFAQAVLKGIGAREWQQAGSSLSNS